MGGLGIGKASCEADRDEKEVDGVGHAEGDEVNDLKVQMCTALIPLRIYCAAHNSQSAPKSR